MVYDIFYPDQNIRQQKRLIKHDEYLSVKNIVDDKEYNDAYKKLGNGMEWFTENSPWYESITTGIFTCNNVSVKCLVTPVSLNK